MNIGKFLTAIVKVAKANPTLVIGAVGVGKQIIKAVKDEVKKPAVEPRA